MKVKNLNREREQDAEPVAFRVDWLGPGAIGLPRFFGYDDQSRMHNFIGNYNHPYKINALYASPPKRKPLPFDAWVEKTAPTRGAGHNFPLGYFNAARDGWNACERAHGIGVSEELL